MILRDGFAMFGLILFRAMTESHCHLSVAHLWLARHPILLDTP
jgi:hypothetical protein